MLKKILATTIALATALPAVPVSAQERLSFSTAGSKYPECRLPLASLPGEALPIMVGRKFKLEKCRAIKIRELRRTREATEYPGKIQPLSRLKNRAEREAIARYMQRPVKEIYYMSI